MRYAQTVLFAALVAISAPGIAAVSEGTALRAPAPTTDALRVARLSTYAIRDHLEFHGYHHIGKITFNGFSYVTRATDRKGRRVKLYVDPDTAKVLKKKFYK